jgi:CBS-domain-containing membrane protein
MDLKASDIMTKVVVTAKMTTPLTELVRIMESRRITGIPIVDDAGKLVGLVAQDDIIFKTRELEARDDRGGRRGLSDLVSGGFVTFADKTKSEPTVESVMTANVHSAHEDMGIRELALMMWEKRVHRIPICDTAGVLTGIVSSMDICRVVAEGKCVLTNV